MNRNEKFTEDDLDNCWEHHKSYFIDVLNGDYDLKEAVSDLRSLIGSAYDSRNQPNHRMNSDRQGRAAFKIT